MFTVHFNVLKRNTYITKTTAIVNTVYRKTTIDWAHVYRHYTVMLTALERIAKTLIWMTNAHLNIVRESK